VCREIAAEKTMGKVFGKVVDHERDVAEALGDVGSEAFYRKILPSEGEFYVLRTSSGPLARRSHDFCTQNRCQPESGIWSTAYAN
jgi:hypothetical protein